MNYSAFRSIPRWYRFVTPAFILLDYVKTIGVLLLAGGGAVVGLRAGRTPRCTAPQQSNLLSEGKRCAA